MIVVYENLDTVHGYYHDGIIHINEMIPDYLKNHVKDYLEECHRRSPELKVYYMRCMTTDPEIFRSIYKDWDGKNITDYLTDDEIRDIAGRMRIHYPEFQIDDDIELIRTIANHCSRKCNE